MQKFRTDLLAIFVILAAIGIFFYRLFFPTLQLIVTPDFGRSDAWHFSFATKYALGTALKQGTLPLWEPKIGDGFPLLAEGQAGTYFLPNLILFSLLPQAVAYNLALVLVFVTFSVGIYVSARLFRASPLASLFGALAATFSGLPVLQLTHITLLQGMSMLPWIFAVTVLLFTRGMFPWMAVLALCITQQMFAGFPQATFLTLILVGSYILYASYTAKNYRKLIPFGIAVALGLAGSAAQLLPSWEFLHQTLNPGGFDITDATQFSMPLKHLASFILPYAFGNPKLGTYPPFYKFDGSIFWENTAYMGLLPLMFLPVAWWQRKKYPLIGFFALLLGGSILLAWGESSPVYIVYSVWPFNLFRVPSRFLWLAVFSVCMMAVMGFDAIERGSRSLAARILLLLCIVLAAFQLMHTWWDYHLYVPASALLDHTPAIQTAGKIYTIGAESTHNAAFLTHGWTNAAPFLSLYQNALSPDANIVQNVTQHDVYAGRFLYRSSVADSVLSLTFDTSGKTATMSSRLMVNLMGIQHVLSYVPIQTTMLTNVREEHTPAGTLYAYDNPTALPEAYVVRIASSAATVREARDTLFTDTFTTGKIALLEMRDINSDPALAQFLKPTKSTSPSVIRVISVAPTHIELSVDAGDTAGLLILGDTYYPGWKATVDDNAVPIYPANIKQRAVVVPKGAHDVVFDYAPASVSNGLTVSLLTEIVVVLLAVAPFGRLSGTGYTAHRLSSGRRRNRGT